MVSIEVGPLAEIVPPQARPFPVVPKAANHLADAARSLPPAADREERRALEAPRRRA